MADDDVEVETRRGVAAEQSKALDAITDHVSSLSLSLCLPPPLSLPHTPVYASLTACYLILQHEERELNQSKVQKAMKDIAESQKASKEAQQKRLGSHAPILTVEFQTKCSACGKRPKLRREKELAAVKVSKEDVQVIVTEFEIDDRKAERRLRECGGDLGAALKSFLVF